MDPEFHPSLIQQRADESVEKFIDRVRAMTTCNPENFGLKELAKRNHQQMILASEDYTERQHTKEIARIKRRLKK